MMQEFNLNPYLLKNSPGAVVEPLVVDTPSARSQSNLSQLKAVVQLSQATFESITDLINQGPIEPRLIQLREQVLSEFYLRLSPAVSKSRPGLIEYYKDLFLGRPVPHLARPIRRAIASRMFDQLTGAELARAPSPSFVSVSTGVVDTSAPSNPAVTRIFTNFATESHESVKKLVGIEGFRRLERLYRTAPEGNLWALRLSPQQLLKYPDDDLRWAYETLSALGGRSGGPGPSPLGCLPLEIIRRGESLELSFELSTIGIVGDVSEIITQYLGSLQRQCESSPIVRAKVTLSGPIPRETLQWMYEGQPEGPGPIPHVRVLYRFPLPSGGVHTTVLKADQSLEASLPQPRESLPESDVRIIAGVVRALRVPRLRTALLTDDAEIANPSPASADKLLSQRLDHHADRSQRWANRLWQKAEEGYSHHLQGGESGRLRRAAYEEVLSSKLSFEKVLADVASRLPQLFPHRPAHQLALHGNELKTFIMERGETLRTHLTELLEKANSIPADQIMKRRARGYRGPDEGYLLPFEVLVLDHCVDFKKVAAYRFRHSTCEVPAERRRMLSRETQWKGVADAVEYLKKATVSREIRAQVDDPLDERGRYFVHGNLVREIGFKVLDSNYERAREIIKELRGRFTSLGSTRRMERLERGAIGIGATTAEAIIDEVRKFDRKVASISQRLAGAVTFAQRASPEKRLQGQAILQVKAPYELLLLQTRIDRARIQEGLIRLAELVDGDAMNGMRARVSSIEDRRMVRFIYGIGYRGVALELMEVGDERQPRVTHSQVLGGDPAFAAGTVTFATHHELFHSFRDWLHFDFAVRRGAFRDWMTTQLDNGTGHYQTPASATLPYAANVLLPEFESRGISTDRCMLVDLLAPGVQLRSV